jgi:hypothetical protein
MNENPERFVTRPRAWRVPLQEVGRGGAGPSPEQTGRIWAGPSKLTVGQVPDDQATK